MEYVSTNVQVPDIVLENFDGPRSFTLIDVKTFDPAGPTHINTNHTDRIRLAAHLAIARNCRETEYGPLPARMRLIVLPISIFGAIGTPGQAFISELSRRVGSLVPFSLLPHASWATPRVGPMIRMALTHAVRRGAWPRPFTPIGTATPGPRAERERMRSETRSPGAASGRGYVLGAMVLLVFTVTL